MVESKRIGIKTNGNSEVIDITGEVAREIDNSSVESGIATVFAVGSTAGITTIEYESGLLADFKTAWDRLIPANMDYRHNRAWGDGNGHSHVRASLLSPSLTVPFVNKRMLLGTWQQIVCVDFDNRPRSREIVVQIMGE
ncbi:MAG: secondary thiamine-phosphate synthase enzyme [Chloroflexi bacterium RBG_13_53_26]|nr:MAG: secondary thiamine-phosphate synthase enzyme [Chloroflexi bacterium RBG_13_53_26]